MTELKRQYRVGMIRMKKDPLAKFFAIVICGHIGFVIAYATLAILSQ